MAPLPLPSLCPLRDQVSRRKSTMKIKDSPVTDSTHLTARSYRQGRIIATNSALLQVMEPLGGSYSYSHMPTIDRYTWSEDHKGLR